MGTWSSTEDNYTVTLRTGVKFQDGTDFNADAVIAHWNRLNWSLNVTGTNMDKQPLFEVLYRLPDGTPIVDSVVKNDNYNITFVLNGRFAPFEALLAFPGSYIQSPTYTATVGDAYIDTDTGDIIGTGPFVYDSYDPGNKVLFHAFDNYWKGEANISDLVFKEIPSKPDRDLALLNGDVHFISDPTFSMLDTFKTRPNLKVLDSGLTSTTFWYLGMNNKLLNKTFREAISYAINYSHVFKRIEEGSAERLESPIPKGILYSNTSFNLPTLNLTRARLVMQSMGFGMGFIDDSQWEAASFITLNFSYNIGNVLREGILSPLQEDLAKIGITVIDGGTSGAHYWRLFTELRDNLDLFASGWGMDYNDPSNVINNLYTNTDTQFNAAQYNGTLAAIEDGRDPYSLYGNVQNLMGAGVDFPDPSLRENYYYHIQFLLIERDFPLAWGFVPKLYHAHNVKLSGFQQNGLDKLDFHACTWEYYIEITSPDSYSTWETGASWYIYWNSTGISSSVKIELFMDNLWEAEINASTPNDGEYLWTIPIWLNDSVNYQIKITDVLDPSKFAYSQLFEVINPTITVISPDSSSIWEADDTVDITWTSLGTIANVKIELYLSGSLEREIVASTPNDGTHSWQVPYDISYSDQYQILISDVSNPAILDLSDYFEIYNQTITVTTPSGLTAWEVETSHTITWTSTGNIADVKIELYLSGSLDSVIIASTSNDGSHSWMIPAGLSNSTFYQIKISDATNPVVHDMSGFFAIYHPDIVDEIPGYDFYLLIMIVGIVSVVLIKKRYTHFKN
jgi:ABC-type transport system substrate-binding protein